MKNLYYIFKMDLLAGNVGMIKIEELESKIRCKDNLDNIHRTCCKKIAYIIMININFVTQIKTIDKYNV